MDTWYSTITNKGSAHEQGLIIEEKTGNAIAVSYKSENAKLIAAAPELLEALKMAEIALRYVNFDGEYDGKFAVPATQKAIQEVLYSLSTSE